MKHKIVRSVCAINNNSCVGYFGQEAIFALLSSSYFFDKVTAIDHFKDLYTYPSNVNVNIMAHPTMILHQLAEFR